MVLPRAVLFPHALMPLFIFEPRYRAMLAHSLERDRIFCIAMMKPGLSEAHSEDDFLHVAGVGLVRACVGHDNGTSHLVLQGLSRVRLGALVQERPFRIAEIHELSAAPGDLNQIDRLCVELREICAKLPVGDDTLRVNLNGQLAQVDDPGMLCDIVAHTFLQDSEHQQRVLEELEIGARLHTIVRYLKQLT